MPPRQSTRKASASARKATNVADRTPPPSQKKQSHRVSQDHNIVENDDFWESDDEHASTMNESVDEDSGVHDLESDETEARGSQNPLRTGTRTSLRSTSTATAAGASKTGPAPIEPPRPRGKRAEWEMDLLVPGCKDRFRDGKWYCLCEDMQSKEDKLSKTVGTRDRVYYMCARGNGNPGHCKFVLELAEAEYIAKQLTKQAASSPTNSSSSSAKSSSTTAKTPSTTAKLPSRPAESISEAADESWPSLDDPEFQSIVRQGHSESESEPTLELRRPAAKIKSKAVTQPIVDASGDDTDYEEVLQGQRAIWKESAQKHNTKKRNVTLDNDSVEVDQARSTGRDRSNKPAKTATAQNRGTKRKLDGPGTSKVAGARKNAKRKKAGHNALVWYCVVTGRERGIFWQRWSEIVRLVHGFPGGRATRFEEGHFDDACDYWVTENETPAPQPKYLVSLTKEQCKSEDYPELPDCPSEFGRTTTGSTSAAGRTTTGSTSTAGPTTTGSSSAAGSTATDEIIATLLAGVSRRQSEISSKNLEANIAQIVEDCGGSLDQAMEGGLRHILDDQEEKVEAIRQDYELKLKKVRHELSTLQMLTMKRLGMTF